MMFNNSVAIHVNYFDEPFDQCVRWCTKQLGPRMGRWHWVWTDSGSYSGERGWYVFYFQQEEDLLAFKLVHGV